MKIKLKIYLVQDQLGNEDYAVTSEGCEDIFIHGLKDARGNSLAFENRAYRLRDWCYDNYLKYDEIEKEFEYKFV